VVLHEDQTVELSELVHMDLKVLNADSLASACICLDEQDMSREADSSGCGCNALNHTEPGILPTHAELDWNQTTQLHSVPELHQNVLLENARDDPQDHEKDR